MLQKLMDYLSRKKGKWKSDFFKEPEKRWYFLLLLAFSVAAICWGIYEYPADPDVKDTAFMMISVCVWITGLPTYAAELLPKSQTQLAGILRMWAVLVAICTVPAVALQFLPISNLH